jgi:hypothetical protein
MADSDNLQEPFFGPEHPVYPAVDTFVRIYAPALIGVAVYPAYAQQLVQNNPPLFRDREPVYVFDPNNSPLGPGYYDARLVGSYLGFPLYATFCCPAGSFSSSSSSSSSRGG